MNSASYSSSNNINMNAPGSSNTSETSFTDLVKLRCVKEGGKLRVRIVSAGYNSFANCQFPRDIRVAGREYLVPAADISFSQRGGQSFFYRVKKNNVKIINCDSDDNHKAAVNLEGLTIYDDETDPDCCVCLDLQKDTAFYPCGHYYCCGNCAKTLLGNSSPCPICRNVIQQLVHKDQFQ